MNKNQLGSSNLFVSEIGLGCMSFEKKEEQQSIYMIHKAIDQGVNLLDTADLYEYGQNEELVAKAIKGKRDQIILATKVGNRWTDDQQGWYWDPSKTYIKQQVKESLRRLQTDYIDLYQLHGGTLDDPIEETIEAFEELKQEGFIRYYGISSIRPNVIREYVHRSNIVSVLTQYSILDRRPEEAMLDLLAENDVSVIVRGPVAKGLLSGKWTEKVKGKNDEGYLDYSVEELTELLPQLEAFPDSTYSFAQLALRYALHHPAVATVIPGASKMEQLEEILDSQHTLKLAIEHVQRIKSLSKANVYTAHR